jgi:hypothetical protein
MISTLEVFTKKLACGFGASRRAEAAPKPGVAQRAKTAGEAAGTPASGRFPS